ncbi:MAG: EamA family transporter [Deltaproteobacteria bacterium]|nr:EamA family transporter [Deltaproteobacteria bacterium]MBW1918666.1 EamA family transporter [Deltaproteobacteria bacterium]MBW1934687.1 EamA family transporter [Deltaproteobacteria bacterium]MBW1976939.1 EamA family transporter [Deltaproteobacteria bacterium]MBW2043523.1 EamA family transporter [Deltaproteobacteria bacterium]
MKEKTTSLFKLHSAILLFGLAGLFGKLLSLSPFIIVLGRAAFAALSLGIILGLSGHQLRVRRWEDLPSFIGLGGLLALHWTTFFHAIQVSTVAIGLLTYATFPAFVTIMEPYFFREKVSPVDVLATGLVVLGIVLIVPSFDLVSGITRGALWGTLSGFSFAILSLLNRKYVKTYSSFVITFYQNAFAALLLLPFFFMETQLPRVRDLLLLFTLGIFCTALAHGLFVKALEHLRAHVASIAACMEPVYGIILALVLLGEVPKPRTVLGGAVILGTALMVTARHKGS